MNEYRYQPLKFAKNASQISHRDIAKLVGFYQINKKDLSLKKEP
ncbi:hypothetical protein [Candidatus Uabimicrobium sp. HlEnr_7]